MNIVIIGSGHNGLIAATVLARKGHQVTVLDEKETYGGATKTEFPFAKAPLLGTSTGSYLLGVMPPEIISRLGANLKLIRRDPHYFLPTLDGRYLLFGSDKKEMLRQFLKFFSKEDWEANEKLTEEISQLRDDLAPSWLCPPLTLAETAEKFIRPHLRQVFMDLTTKPVEDYLARFSFKSELLMAMYAVTDGFSGLHGSFGTPATGMNFMVHNMCRLPGSDGTWMIVQGGMGQISREFARLAMEAGAKILTQTKVEKILIEQNRATGVLATHPLKGLHEIKADIVLSNADPFRMRNLVGSENFPDSFNQKLDGFKRMGTTMKVNLALKKLPSFTCLPENRGQHNGTIHLLPQGPQIMKTIRTGFEKVLKGELDQFPTIEWYIHTQADPTLQDKDKNHNSAFFIQWVPYELKGTTWEKEEDKYVKHLINLAEQFAPGFADSVVDTFTLTPKKIEEHFGITYGHIHHVDNTFGFDQRMPYHSPISGLYSCSSGCHPAGSVLGAAGWNSANLILSDIES